MKDSISIEDRKKNIEDHLKYIYDAFCYHFNKGNIRKASDAFIYIEAAYEAGYEECEIDSSLHLEVD